MICCVCEKEIPRGKRFKSPMHKSKPFCSEGCYQAYLDSAPQPSPSRELTDYIQSVWPEEPNYGMLMKQAAQYLKDYDLTYTSLRGILKYAIEIENVKVEPSYGLGQFIPRYIDLYKEFIQKIKKNTWVANRLTGEEFEPIKIRPTKQKRYRRKEQI